MKTLSMTPQVYEYVLANSELQTEILAEVRAETAKLPMGRMQIAPDQGAFMHWLAKTLQARWCIEVGTFTGYSAISVASALPTDGRLITMDIDPEFRAIAKKYFDLAALSDKIDSRLGDAKQILKSLLAENLAGKFDFAFIDADKPSMPEYFELCLRLLRPGGVLLADNVLWGGKVVDSNDRSEDTVAIREFNQKVRNDPRVDGFLLHISDGIYCLRKK